MRIIFRENHIRLGRQKANTLWVRCQEATAEVISGQPSTRVNNTLEGATMSLPTKYQTGVTL